MTKTTLLEAAREYFQRTLADAGQEHARYDEVYLLPFQIEFVKLENIGLFKEFKAKFQRNAINVIYGSDVSGKSRRASNWNSVQRCRPDRCTQAYPARVTNQCICG